MIALVSPSALHAPVVRCCRVMLVWKCARMAITTIMVYANSAQAHALSVHQLKCAVVAIMVTILRKEQQFVCLDAQVDNT